MKNMFSLSSADFALFIFEFLLSAAAVAGSEWNTASGKNCDKSNFHIKSDMIDFTLKSCAFS